MFEVLTSFLALMIPYVLALVAITLVEWVSPMEPFEWTSRLRGFFFSTIGKLVRAIAIAPILALLVIGSPWTIIDLSALPFAVNLLLILVLIDFLAYWEHRFEHRFLWPVHMVHHSPRKLHAANTWGHPLQFIPMRIFKFLPLAFIDFGGVKVPFAVMLFLLFHTYWIHSQTHVHLGPLRKVFVDNRYHRLHHGIDQKYHDCNFGIVLSVWDRIFGTVIDPKSTEHPAIGVQGVDEPKNAFQWLWMPFDQWHKQIKSARPSWNFRHSSDR